MKQTDNKNKRTPCVYTVLLGDYEQLNEQHIQSKSEVPFICLTDNPNLKSETWNIVQIEPNFAMDPIRSQRLLKICPHLISALSAYDFSIYIDNSVVLESTPEEIFNRYSHFGPLCVPTHSFRETILDEFIEVARFGVDDQGRVFEQLNHYLACGEPALSERPYWTGILLRDIREKRTQNAMELWASHVLRYSRRDQLSFNLAVQQANASVARIDIDTFSSWMHRWPRTRDRKLLGGIRHPFATHTPLAAELRILQRDAAASRVQKIALQSELHVLGREVEGMVNSLSVRIHLHSVERENLRSQIETLRATMEMERQTSLLAQESRLEELALVQSNEAISELLQDHESQLQSIASELWDANAALDAARAEASALKASTSWRITAPLRWMMGRLTFK